MDGNRRFAKSHRIETVEGHNLGFEALAKVCLFVTPRKEIHLFSFCVDLLTVLG